MNKASLQMADNIKSTTSTLDSYKDKITELQAVLTDHSSTVEEVASAKQQLLDIQSELTEKYGSEASGIDLVNGSLETQLKLSHLLLSSRLPCITTATTTIDCLACSYKSPEMICS